MSHAPTVETLELTIAWGEMIRLQWKKQKHTHMGIVEGVCNSTHEHGSPCATLKRREKANSKGQTGPHVSLWCTISSTLWGETRSLFSGPFSAERTLVWFLHSQHFIERKLNLTCKTITERKASAMWCKHHCLLSIFWQISWQRNYLLGIPAKDLIVTCVITR